MATYAGLHPSKQMLSPSVCASAALGANIEGNLGRLTSKHADAQSSLCASAALGANIEGNLGVLTSKHMDAWSSLCSATRPIGEASAVAGRLDPVPATR